MTETSAMHVEIHVVEYGADEDDHLAIAGLTILLDDESGIEMIEPVLVGVPGPPTFSQTSRIVLALMSAGLLRRLGAVLRTWLGVESARVAKITIDGHTIELRHGSEGQYDRLVDAYIARVSDRPRIESGQPVPTVHDRSKQDLRKRRPGSSCTSMTGL
jgi:hypothetical protein